MPRYAFKIEYDGADFSGWQFQDGLQTVQRSIEEALYRLNPEPVRIVAAGRTDSGVHAVGQVIHADLAREWAPLKLREALNAHLRPAPVVASHVALVADDFSARFSAIGREYRYRILNRAVRPVQERGTLWHVRHSLCVSEMRHAAGFLIGKHDFTTFRASQCQAASPIKSIDRIEITATPLEEGKEICFNLSARSFLHNQVRSIVGTLERVGAGAWSADRVKEALEARDRSRCGPVAPAHGLSLMNVIYPSDPFAEENEALS